MNKKDFIELNGYLVKDKQARILIDEKSNPIYYGADPTGTKDSSEAIQNCLDANIHKQVTFTTGTYLINSPIEIDYSNYDGCIDFNNSILVNNTENDFAIGIGTKNVNLDVPNSPLLDKQPTRYFYFKNVHIISNSTYAILIDRWFLNAHLQNFQIYAYKNGIQLGKTYDNYVNKPIDAQFSDFLITSDDMSQDYIGINVIGTDSKFRDGRIYGFKTGIYSNNRLWIDNIHFLACNMSNVETLDSNYACLKGSLELFANMCYCDTYPTFFKYEGNSSRLLNIDNLFIYSYSNRITEGKILDFTNLDTNTKDLAVHLNNVDFCNSNYPETSQIIALPTLDRDRTARLKGLIANSTFKGIHYENPYKLGDYICMDIVRDVKGTKYVNQYWPIGNIKNWLFIGSIVFSQAGNYTYNIETQDGKRYTFVLSIDANDLGSIFSIRTVQKTDDYLYLGAIKIAPGCYKLYACASLNQDINLSNTLTIDCAMPFCAILPATNRGIPYTTETVDEVELHSQ